VLAAAAASALALDAELKKQALSEDGRERWKACEALGKEGSPEAVKLLVGILRSDPELDNRDHAVWWCWYVATDAGIDVIASAVSGPTVNQGPRRVRARQDRKPHALDALSRIAKNDAIGVGPVRGRRGDGAVPDEPRRSRDLRVGRAFRRPHAAAAARLRRRQDREENGAATSCWPDGPTPTTA